MTLTAAAIADAALTFKLKAKVRTNALRAVVVTVNAAKHKLAPKL